MNNNILNKTMIERLLVYKRFPKPWPEEYSAMVVDYDRKKIDYIIVKKFRFINPRDKRNRSIHLFSKLESIAKENNCDKFMGETEFRVEYMLEKYNNNKSIKKTKPKKK